MTHGKYERDIQQVKSDLVILRNCEMLVKIKSA